MTIKKRRGFSVIEIIIASAVFAIFSSGAIYAVIGGLSIVRLGRERGIAREYAIEGLEAVRSIRNRDFSKMSAVSATGVAQNSGAWDFSGQGNTFDKYNRVISIEDIYRDGGGNIVSSGGTIDPDMKKISVAVNWSFLPGRDEVLRYASYLSNFMKPILASPSGVIFYSDSAINPSSPRYRFYDDGSASFSSEASSPTGTPGKNFSVKTSPIRAEAIAAYGDQSGMMRVLCYDGAVWSNEWSAFVGGDGATKRFDVVYETNSGDALVVYSSNSTANELIYRSKRGSAGCGADYWSPETAMDSPGTAGTVQWVKIASDTRRGSDLAAAVWADENADLQGAVWDGSVFIKREAPFETSLEVVALPQDVQDFDIDFEGISGDIMVVWSNSSGTNGINGVRYSTCNGGGAACSWSSPASPPILSDDATNLSIAANPQTDEIIFASTGNAGSDFQVGYWCGSAWNNVGGANKDTSAESPAPGTQMVATGWLTSSAGKVGMAFYTNISSRSVDYAAIIPNAASPCLSAPTWTPTGSFTVTPSFGRTRLWSDFQTDPKSPDRGMFTAVDVNYDLFAKRIILKPNGSLSLSSVDGAAALGVSLSGQLTEPFSYAYFRY